MEVSPEMERIKRAWYHRTNLLKHEHKKEIDQCNHLVEQFKNDEFNFITLLARIGLIFISYTNFHVTTITNKEIFVDYVESLGNVRLYVRIFEFQVDLTPPLITVQPPADYLNFIVPK